MAALETLGGETWFRLGDGDLATHVERTRRLAAGESLSAITDDFRRRLGIAARILPMSDDRVRTRLRHRRRLARFPGLFRAAALRTGRCASIAFAGADDARPHPDFLAALARPASCGLVVICPSNPFISIDPILRLPGMRAALARLPRAGRRGVADHRRQGGQGPDRQDDGRAGPAGRRRRGGAALPRLSSTSTSPTRPTPLRSPGSTCRSCWPRR